MRQRIRGGIARERRVDDKQLRLDLAGPGVHEGDRLREYAVLVTDVAYPLVSIGQVYRKRSANPSCAVGGGGLTSSMRLWPAA